MFRLNVPRFAPRQVLGGRSNHRTFTASAAHPADFTHTIIGGGAVGLAIARHLTLSHPDASVLLIERHGTVGTETSSRNSEVIHAGLYYGHNTLKTDLCIAGKQQLYELCNAHSIPFRNTKKWIIAQDDDQMGELEKMHKFANEIGFDKVPTRFLPRSEIASKEPEVRADAGVLESSSTGVFDSHTYMQFLEADFLDRGGTTVLHTSVASVARTASGDYEINTRPVSSASDTPSSQESITTETLINSAGLAAIPLSNSILPAHRHIKPFYAKGTYYSYIPPRPNSYRPRVNTLLYPAPVPGHGGLGTHLTIDLNGRVRFGPDVQWVDDPNDLAPNANESQIVEAVEMIRSYLPKIERDGINLDYCGIRPKLGKTSGTAGPNFADFYIKEESEDGFPGFVNLLGIESPGLTSSLAIAEYVERILYGSQKGKGEQEAKQAGKDVRFEFDH